MHTSACVSSFSHFALPHLAWNDRSSTFFYLLMSPRLKSKWNQTTKQVVLLVETPYSKASKVPDSLWMSRVGGIQIGPGQQQELNFNVTLTSKMSWLVRVSPSRPIFVFHKTKWAIYRNVFCQPYRTFDHILKFSTAVVRPSMRTLLKGFKIVCEWLHSICNCHQWSMFFGKMQPFSARLATSLFATLCCLWFERDLTKGIWIRCPYNVSQQTGNLPIKWRKFQR